MWMTFTEIRSMGGGAGLKSYLVNEENSEKKNWVWPRQAIHSLQLV
jgi:hypothetical protein